MDAQQVYLASDPVNAEIFKDYLLRHGIDARVRDYYVWGGMGELPANLYPSVWIDNPADYERARELVTAFEAERDDAEDWRCPRCREWLPGQFEACWRCGAARPD